jgi:hypothetical protein
MRKEYYYVFLEAATADDLALLVNDAIVQMNKYNPDNQSSGIITDNFGRLKYWCSVTFSKESLLGSRYGMNQI